MKCSVKTEAWSGLPPVICADSGSSGLTYIVACCVGVDCTSAFQNKRTQQCAWSKRPSTYRVSGSTRQPSINGIYYEWQHEPGRYENDAGMLLYYEQDGDWSIGEYIGSGYRAHAKSSLDVGPSYQGWTTYGPVGWSTEASVRVVAYYPPPPTSSPTSSPTTAGAATPQPTPRPTYIDPGSSSSKTNQHKASDSTSSHDAALNLLLIVGITAGIVLLLGATVYYYRQQHGKPTVTVSIPEEDFAVAAVHANSLDPGATTVTLPERLAAARSEQGIVPTVVKI